MVVALLPVLGDGDITLIELASSYVLVLLSVGAFLYGLLLLVADLTVPKLLLLGAVAGAASVAAIYLGGRPEELMEGPTVRPLALLFLADIVRVVAAACVGLALARRVTSTRIALLVAALVTAADLFSVFAGPTKALVESGAPALDYLLLIFPTFGYPLGFALGLSDFVFLALFTALARSLEGLHPLPTLILGFVAIILAMLAGILFARPLPALPFISLAFALANATSLYKSFI
jgi:hypothetical protein